MQSDRDITFVIYSKYQKSIGFIFSTILFVAITPNLLAQPKSVADESDGTPEQPVVDSHPAELASPSTETESDNSLQRAADDSLEQNQTDAPDNALEQNQTDGPDQPAPVDFGAMDAPQLKTTVTDSIPKQTEIVDLTTTRADADQRDEPRGDAPKARVGVQGSVWPSFNIPFGKFDSDRDISHIRGVGYNQVVLIGYKILPEFLVGLQIDMLYSVRGDVLDDACEDEGDLCISRGMGIGVQVQAHLFPNRFVNPWIGYGIGISYLTVTNKPLVGDLSFSAPSFNFAQISTGADFRLNRAFGLGPFIRFGAGVFFHQIEAEDQDMDDSAIEDQALHFQLDIGVRCVFTP